MTAFWVYPYRGDRPDDPEVYGVMEGEEYDPEFPALGKQHGVAFDRETAERVVAAMRKAGEP